MTLLYFKKTTLCLLVTLLPHRRVAIIAIHVFVPNLQPSCLFTSMCILLAQF